VIRLPVEPLEAAAFAPYGRVVALPQRPQDAAGPGWRWWAETAYLVGDGRAWGVGYLDLWPADRQFDWAERHLRTQEAVFATSADLLVYVAPADHPEDPARLPPPDRFRVFRVPPGAGVVMDRAVWHGAPLAEVPTRALVLILEGTGRHDVTMVRFPAGPIGIVQEG
jgi:ureidoglycolate lyase